ncbi:SLAP domain-containing protein [Lactobacillus acetotolerans]|uniref:SLAP domain-containing protein n=3 Tax=Lactobacillus acetotolerans TaxID=1600 RepID=UPI0012E8449C|nr:SLAP domain-containing protein [Lactobacillus acetotolerans]QGV03970.1 hypothetical protein GJR85_00360 [Lactobacillus acetotolerans]
MKKNKKIISLTLAALLAVSAVAPITSIKPAKAEIIQSGTEVTEPPYFTYNDQRLADGATIPGTGLPFKEGQTLNSLGSEALDAVRLHVNGQTYKEFGYGDVDMNNELRKQNITVNGPDQNAQITGEISGFTVTLTTAHHYTYKGKPATVVIPFGTGVGFPSDKAPQVEFQEDGKDTKLPINGQYFQVARGAKFDPLDFTASDGTEYKITAPDYDLSVADNPVDTSKAGNSSTVKLDATNKKTGKKMIVSYTVLISPKGERQLVNGWDPQYYLDSETHLPVWASGSNLYNKTKVLPTSDTKIIDGTSYTKVKQDGKNTLMKTIDLVNTKPVTGGTVTKTVMHKAVVYDDKGKATSKTIPAFKKIKVNSVHQSIGSQSYYELADNSGYIKVGNIDGTKRTLIHNAYVYRSSNHRANSKVLKNGVSITTYGASFKFKNGKRYYRVGGPSKQYAKVSNFNS